jgi:hypothetical protein
MRIKEGTGKDRRMNRRALIEVILLLSSSITVAFNSIILKSTLIGFLAMPIFSYVMSMAFGKLFYPDEGPFFKRILGLVTFIVIIALLGTFLILLGMFTTIISIACILSISMVLYFVSMLTEVHSEGVSKHLRGDESKNLSSYVLAGSCLVFLGIAFFGLLSARTGEGSTSVWLTIPSFFLPVFFFSSLLLVVILLFTSINYKLKLMFLAVHSFLSHSLFLLVWYPGRHGDPWFHMGASRFIDKTGMPYAYAWLLQAMLVVDIVKHKTHYALVVFFSRTFSLDIYWIHVFLIPLLWSFLVPIFSYKIAELLTGKKTKFFPLIATVSTGLFPTLVYWGAISVPNSLGFFFLFFSVVLLLCWVKSGKKRLLFLSFLTSTATFFAHPQVGIFALFFTVWITIMQKSKDRLVKIVSYPMIWVLYPLAARLQGATFSLEGLLSLDNLLSFLSNIITLPFIFLFAGLLFGIRKKRFNNKSTTILFFSYVAVIISYYITDYAMENMPFGAPRILAVADFLSIPFVALGLLATARLLKKGFSSMNWGSLKKATPHSVSLLIIFLFLSLQTSFALYQAYPLDEPKVQPAVFEIEAIQYIYESWEETGRFVVLCDAGFANLANGLLGADYRYGVNPRGIFGAPNWDYWTVEYYSSMCRDPSITIMKDAMIRVNANASYFVVSVRRNDFVNVVQRVSAILPIVKSFGNASHYGDEYPRNMRSLYMFRYPYPLPPVKEGLGPTVKVIYDDGASTVNVQTWFRYLDESDVNYTLTLSNHTIYEITDYPKHWTILKVTIDGSEMQFDESSDVNTFIYLVGLKPSEILDVTWHANDFYPDVVWKEDSFKTGWSRHPLYPGTIIPMIATDGNILNISGTFASGEYQYYYYINRCNINVTSNDQIIILRWKSTARVATVAFAYADDEAYQYTVVPYSSQSDEWTVTFSEELQQGKEIAYIMVGITNLNSQGISGSQTIYVDYILVTG